MDNLVCTKKDPFGQQFNMKEQEAYEKGYRYISGCVVSPHGKKIALSLTPTGYLKFSIRVGSRSDGTSQRKAVMVHRLVAYQKYGKMIYGRLVARHKDGNKQNNEPDNIFLGSQKQNMQDIAKEDRMEKAIVAATSIRRFTDTEIQEIRNNHTTYKETMQRYGIKSKGSLWEILNRDYVTKKAG
jgi:hypothetical protein